MKARMRGLLLITVVAALALAGSAGAQNPTLFGTVGPGFSIRVVDGAGNRVTRIPPGTYTVQVNDLAAEHNFHLSGPAGLDMSTTVDGTGSVTWTVTFQEGTYHYQCDPHANIMKGDITVENGAPLPAPASPPPTTTTTSTPLPPAPPPPRPVRKLIGSVGPGATISLRFNGRRVTALKAGLVSIMIADRSAKDNFRLKGIGVNRGTSKLGRSAVTWRVTLKRGLYVYSSDATPTLRGAFRVT
jgi:hypothetical protein